MLTIQHRMKTILSMFILDTVPRNPNLQDFDAIERGRQREQCGDKTEEGHNIPEGTLQLNFQMSQGRESSQINNLNIQHIFWFLIVDLTRVNYSRNAQSR